MTKVGRILFEEGMEEGLEKGMEKGMEKGLEKGMEKGLEKGMEKGLEKGMEKGMREGRHRTLQLVSRIFTVLKSEPSLTNKEIADKLYCDESEVDAIRKLYP